MQNILDIVLTYLCLKLFFVFMYNFYLKFIKYLKSFTKKLILLNNTIIKKIIINSE